MIDIDAIRRENQEKIDPAFAKQIFDKLLVDLYSERTHFIFELLQNAEDALREHSGKIKREVQFRLYPDRLEFAHFGRPFNEDDVRSICDVNKSTKAGSGDAIGKHGIGFKSVYAFTDAPRISSGGIDFEIETFIFPKATSGKTQLTEEGQTIISVPFNSPRIPSTDAFDKLNECLRSLDVRSFLFLRQINYVSIQIGGEVVGEYVRQESSGSGVGFRPVTILWDEGGESREEHWLLYDETGANGLIKSSPTVELAFKLKDKNGTLAALDHSELSVFFPTEQETHCGFLIQGPFVTTPSRDNIDYQSKANLVLMARAGVLARSALLALAAEKRLGPDALRCFLTIPEAQARTVKGGIFLPIYQQIWQSFASDRVIPLAGGGYAKANEVAFSPSKEVRELFSSTTQGDKFHSWVSDEITERLTPELHAYLRNGLQIPEVSLLQLIRRLSAQAFAKQSVEWLLRLYKAINRVSEVRHSSSLRHEIPIVRLSDNSHVVAFSASGKPNAYLPGPLPSSLPIVSKSLADDPNARELLTHLKLTVPDVVDEVVDQVLPIFATIDPKRINSLLPSLRAILRAWSADTLGSAREKLLRHLGQAAWVPSVSSDGKSGLKRPTEVYFPTSKLKTLFKDVPDIWFANLDIDYQAPREIVRELLLKCGAREQLRRALCRLHLGYEELATLRRESGLEAITWTGEELDYEISGLDSVLKQCATGDYERAKTLLSALVDLRQHDREQSFSGSYRWGYSHQQKTVQFRAKFVDQLRTTAWLPNPESGHPITTAVICFSDLGPDFQELRDEFVLEQLGFKKELIKLLAEESKIPVEWLQLLQQAAAAGLGKGDLVKMFAEMGITVPGKTIPPDQDETNHEDGGLDSVSDDELEHTESDDDPDGESTPGGSGRARTTDSPPRGGGAGAQTRQPSLGVRTSSNSYREFHSYVSVHSDNPPHESAIPQEERMKIEDEAVALLVEADGRTFALKRMPTNHPGYDIEARDSATNELVRLIEVKSLAGSWDKRPVTMSITQFAMAQDAGDRFWLYVIENVRNKPSAKIHRIQNPAGNAKYFCFDHGWSQIAQ